MNLHEKGQKNYGKIEQKFVKFIPRLRWQNWNYISDLHAYIHVAYYGSTSCSARLSLLAIRRRLVVLISSQLSYQLPFIVLAEFWKLVCHMVLILRVILVVVNAEQLCLNSAIRWIAPDNLCLFPAGNKITLCPKVISFIYKLMARLSRIVIQPGH